MKGLEEYLVAGYAVSVSLMVCIGLAALRSKPPTVETRRNVRTQRPEQPQTPVPSNKRMSVREWRRRNQKVKS